MRLKEHLAAEVERLATQERRSLAQMVEILLEQALRLEEGGMERIMDGDEPVGILLPKEATDRQIEASVERIATGRGLNYGQVREDREVKPDFKGGK